MDSVDASSVHVFVEDTGSGIPKECQKEIFDRFYKVDTFKQGTGLGLSICKTIVEHLQGDIFVESEQEGQPIHCHSAIRKTIGGLMSSIFMRSDTGMLLEKLVEERNIIES